MANLLVTDDILKLNTEALLQWISDNIYKIEEYSIEEVGNLVDLNATQVAELSAIISDTIIAKTKVFSSFHTDELIKDAVIEANNYADSLIGQISSISLEYVTELPTIDIKSNVIYILQGTPNTLNVYNNSTSAFVTVGNLNIDLTQYSTIDQVNTLLAEKANKTEIVSQDDVVQNLNTLNGTTVLSTSGLQIELNKKMDKSQLVIEEKAFSGATNATGDLILGTELDDYYIISAYMTSHNGGVIPMNNAGNRWYLHAVSFNALTPLASTEITGNLLVIKK